MCVGGWVDGCGCMCACMHVCMCVCVCVYHVQAVSVAVQKGRQQKVCDHMAVQVRADESDSQTSVS